MSVARPVKVQSIARTVEARDSAECRYCDMALVRHEAEEKNDDGPGEDVFGQQSSGKEWQGSCVL